MSSGALKGSAAVCSFLLVGYRLAVADDFGCCCSTFILVLWMARRVRPVWPNPNHYPEKEACRVKRQKVLLVSAAACLSDDERSWQEVDDVRSWWRCEGTGDHFSKCCSPNLILV